MGLPLAYSVYNIGVIIYWCHVRDYIWLPLAPLVVLVSGDLRTVASENLCLVE